MSFIRHLEYRSVLVTGLIATVLGLAIATPLQARVVQINVTCTQADAAVLDRADLAGDSRSERACTVHYPSGLADPAGSMD